MYIKNKNLNLLNNLISGIGIIILGVIITKGSITMYTKVINLLVCVFLIYGFSKFVNFILNKKIVKNNQLLIGIILNILLGIVMILFPKLSLSLLPIIFSLYLLFNSAVKFVNYIVLKEIKLKSRFKPLFFSLIFLLFAIPFLFYPLKRLDFFIMIIGFYCILLGINRVYEFVVDLISDKYKIIIKKKIRISLPVFLEAFLPQRALKVINKYIEYLTSEEKDKNDESDLKIFIHLSKYGFNQLGHMDIMFLDKIYSYGNYDKDSQKLFTTLGDGVLFTVSDKEKYIDFCVSNSNKTIVEYGVKLSNKEKLKLQKELDKIMSDSYEWKPPVALDKNGIYKDYASRLYMKTNAKFYKFKTGEFKTYFVVGVNCSYFADRLMRNCVFEVLKIVGIISPGTYYEYLEENYRKKYSKVVQRVIYSKECW